MNSELRQEYLDALGLTPWKLRSSRASEAAAAREETAAAREETAAVRVERLDPRNRQRAHGGCGSPAGDRLY